MANQPAPAPPENTPGSSDGDHDDDVDVVCWVCMGMYTDPVSLSCGHTVCLKCARETLVAAAKLASSRPCGLGTSPSASPPSASSCSLPGQTNSAASATSLNREYRIDASETVEVTCPFQCTKTTTIKTNTTGGGLKPNTVVNELVENRKTELLRATLCEAPYCCVEPACSPSPATCKCSWCHDLLFCGPCFKQHHQRGAFKLHKATEISPNVTYSCRIHGGKERDLLCSCGISICYLCEKSEKHSGHTSRPLTDSLPKKITEVQGFIQQLSGISNEEATAITQMNTEKLSITKAISSGSISILDDLQAIQCTLEGRCKEINLIAQSLSDSMGHNLDAQNNSLEVVLKSHQGLISKANEVVQQRNPMDVLKAHSILSSLLSAKVLLDKHRLEPCEQAKAIRCMTGPRDELIGMIKKYGTVNKGRLPNPPSGGRAPVCTRKSDTIITVQWEPPSPHDEQMDIEQVVGYSVLVSPSSNHTASASLPETTTSPPSSLSPSTLKTTGGGARDGVRGPLEAVATVALFEVKGKETTKCEVTVEPKELAVSVCAVSLVGSSAPTQSATVATTPPREVEVFVWGAAGGANGGNCMAGGPGGFSTARMVLKTGTRLTIVVGQGGAGNCSGSGTATRKSFGGGGSGGKTTSYWCGAGGGGCSAVMFDGVPLVVAGGGGGSAVNEGSHGFGGGGGGEEGSADGDQRKRATQNSPGGWGDSSPQCGDKFRGGDGADDPANNTHAGGGGGGGLYGGGGGHIYSQKDNGGGGGSGFAMAPTGTTGVRGVCSCVAAVLSSRTVCGQRATATNAATTPPEKANEHYRGGAGACAAPASGQTVDGNHGLVVVLVGDSSSPPGDKHEPTKHVFEYTGQNQDLLIP